MLTLWFWLVWGNVVIGWDVSNVNNSSETEVLSSSSREMNLSVAGGGVLVGELGGATSAALVAPLVFGGSADVNENAPTVMRISGSGDASQSPANCLAQMDCDSLGDFVPPPDLMFFLPPPPLPAFLFTESAILSEGHADVTSGEERICNLCNWALGINASVSLDTAPNAVVMEVQGSPVDLPTSPPGDNTVNNGPVDAHGGSEGSGGSSLATLSTTTTSPDDRATWISILVAASFGSAAIGAVLMVILLKCRKFKILPVPDSCPILPDSYFSSKSNSSSSSSSSSSGGNQEVVGVDPDETHGTDSSGNPTTRGGGGGGSLVVTKPPRPTEKSRPTTGSGWNFWRRSRGSQSSTVAEHPLRSPGSTICSAGENSYSEEPYVVSEHSSALYAELNSVCQQQDAGVGIGAAPFYRTYSMNTYSEVSDPLKLSHHCHCPHHHHHHHHHHRRLISDGAYENAAYVVSDNEHFSHCAVGQGGASSPGLQVETDSLDTPSSSAYYSDSSNQTSGQKRRKQVQQQDMMMDCVNGGDVPPPPPPPDSLAMDSVLPMDQMPPVVYYPCDFGGRLVRYGHDRYGLVPLNHQTMTSMQPVEPNMCCAAVAAAAAAAAADDDVKRPLPPPPPPCPSTVRPLPPVPSQYV